MKCIVTGGAGFIGSNLVDRLIEDNHTVIIFDDLSTGKEENINQKAKFFLVDVSYNKYFEDKKMEDVMTGVDIVFHLAAFPRVEPSIEEPIHAHNMNINGTVLGDTPLACPGDPICCTPSWNCSGDPTWLCSDPGDGTGQYTSLANCQANCAPIPPDPPEDPPQPGGSQCLIKNCDEH